MAAVRFWPSFPLPSFNACQFLTWIRQSARGEREAGPFASSLRLAKISLPRGFGSTRWQGLFSTGKIGPYNCRREIESDCCRLSAGRGFSRLRFPVGFWWDRLQQEARCGVRRTELPGLPLRGRDVVETGVCWRRKPVARFFPIWARKALRRRGKGMRAHEGRRGATPVRHATHRLKKDILALMRFPLYARLLLSEGCASGPVKKLIGRPGPGHPDKEPDPSHDSAAWARARGGRRPW